MLVLAGRFLPLFGRHRGARREVALHPGFVAQHEGLEKEVGLVEEERIQMRVHRQRARTGGQIRGLLIDNKWSGLLLSMQFYY